MLEEAENTEAGSKAGQHTRCGSRTGCGGKEPCAAGQSLLAAHGLTLSTNHTPGARLHPSPCWLLAGDGNFTESHPKALRHCNTTAGDPDGSSYNSRSTCCSWNLLLPTGRACLSTGVRNKPGYFLLKQMRSAAVLQRRGVVASS